MKILKTITLIMSLLLVSLQGDTIKVFVASSAKLAMSEIANEFKKANPNDEVVLTFGGTGKGYAQLTNGFDYDIFMGADNVYTSKILNDGNAVFKPQVYALGILAIYSNDTNLIKLGINALKSDKVKHIAIANPKLAPYGVAATEIIDSYGLNDIASSKIVMGDNIAQSVQFVDSGAADIGIVAFSLLKETQPKEKYFIVDSSKYKPLEQSFVITKYSKKSILSIKFASFINSKKAKDIFKKYGFATK